MMEGREAAIHNLDYPLEELKPWHSFLLHHVKQEHGVIETHHSPTEACECTDRQDSCVGSARYSTRIGGEVQVTVLIQTPIDIRSG